ncbi:MULTISPECIES: DUF4230 domain-containing protein [Peptostreptococcaceae]|uniref:DUF4230 domain-containing protein n=2 Tax=Peptostreptococcaceae TaxID=186804 RepID=A0ABR7K565_9FIRM|nr:MULTISPECIES: DUF4230 domain-containing protein [Paeniclostridium]MBC6004256.1 DUF4230 domain-containing protein [Paeniclostridium hominis]MDU2591960.1 DUF4230 domain-containing protein [Paeniclostridium sordellii]
MLQKRKKINNNKVLLIFIIIGIILGITLSLKLIFSEKAPKDTSKVLNTIEQVLELSTSKYNYSNIVTIKKDRSFKNIKIPFTEKSFIIKYNGVVKGGVNSKDITIDNVKKDSITVNVAKCSIIDHYIDEENIFIYDVKNALFNRVKTNEVIDELANSKKEYEKKIIKEGFMNDISRSVKKSLENSLKNLGYEEVIINFK